ncbi:DUF2946 family protein [Hyphomonas sp.]|uniref:DUF2946 family protein n=1 Tax=Hyphomonas sp. TaxID=87 RepID=UPI00333E1959
MWQHLSTRLARALAVIALISQALMPGMMAAASARPGDMPAVLCALPGDGVHAAAGRQVGAELAQLIAKKSKPAPTDSGHDCPACLLAFAATLPEPVNVKAPVSIGATETAPVFEVRFVHAPRGPPVGSRAPPASMKA